MMSKRKLSWSLIRSIVVLTIAVASLVGCAQSTLNIETDQDYSKAVLSEDYDDYYTIAFGNMVNVDAAAKFKQDTVLYTVSNIQFKYGEYKKALNTVNQALEFSNNLNLVANKIKFLELLTDYEAKDTLVKQVISEHSERYPVMSIDEKLYYNYLLISDGHDREAIRNYTEILNSNVDSSYLEALYNDLGLAHLNLNENEDAKIYLTLSLKSNPDDSITLSNLGNSYYGLNDFQRAFELYAQAIQNDPYNTYAIYGYASAAQELENYDTAVDTWTTYLDLLPMDMDGWIGLYAGYLSLEDLEGQKKSLEALTALAPYDRSFAYDQLIAHHEMGILTDSGDVTKSYREATSDFEADWLIADFTYNYVSAEQGVSLYEALVSNDDLEYSEYSSLADDIYYLDESELFELVLGKVEENFSREARLEIEAYQYYYAEDAVKLLEVASEIIEINPKSGFGYEYLGDAYYFEMDYESAASSYGLAVTLSEDAYYSLKSQVDCLILLGRMEEAKQLNEQFLEIYSDDAFGYVYQARINMKMSQEEAAVDDLVMAFSLSSYLDHIFETYEELSSLKGHPKLDEFDL
ncbi:MAG: tetratricopeptide repeat protein [Bacillota bacterium]|nr:tetratricopeptide repeat protein [Bacillota bacterium]